MASTNEFAVRLNQACDDSPDIPEYGKGRQTVLADKMGVSQEAVRKWLAGEATPKKDKVKALATILGVDEAWLALGIAPTLTARERKLAGRAVEGVVLIMAGAIQLAGGNCAFPTEDDPRSSYVDIYAIVKGIKVDINVSTAREIDDDTYEVVVPREFKDVRCFVYFTAVGVMFNIVEVPTQVIEKQKILKGGGYALIVRKNGNRYFAGEDELPKLKANGGLI